MPVPTSFDDLSETPSSNSPQGSEPVGTNANEYLQAAFAFIKQLHEGFTPLNTLTAPVGTRLVLQQSSAPAGWTIDANAALTDAAMRFNQSASTGGVNAFSWFNNGYSGTSGSTAITTAQMPAHGHGVNDLGHSHGAAVVDSGHSHGVSDAGHSHPSLYGNFFNTANSDVGYVGNFGGGGSGIYQTSKTEKAATGIAIQTSGTGIGVQIGVSAAGISIASNGSGQGHTHSFAFTPNIKYVDCIVAVKS